MNVKSFSASPKCWATCKKEAYCPLRVQNRNSSSNATCGNIGLSGGKIDFVRFNLFEVIRCSVGFLDVDADAGDFGFDDRFDRLG